MMNNSQEFEDLLTEVKIEAIQQSKGRLDIPGEGKIPGVDLITINDTDRGTLKFLEKLVQELESPDSRIIKYTIRYFLLESIKTNKWKRWIRKGDRAWDDSGQLYIVTDLIDTHPFWEKLFIGPKEENQMLELLEEEVTKSNLRIDNSKPVDPDYSKIPDIFK